VLHLRIIGTIIVAIIIMMIPRSSSAPILRLPRLGLRCPPLAPLSPFPRAPLGPLPVRIRHVPAPLGLGRGCVVCPRVRAALRLQLQRRREKAYAT
jgi:hypothetical protein